VTAASAPDTSSAGQVSSRSGPASRSRVGLAAGMLASGGRARAANIRGDYLSARMLTVAASSGTDGTRLPVRDGDIRRASSRLGTSWRATKMVVQGA
jgi:hypothetical protein